MRTFIVKLAFAGATAFGVTGLGACTADVHDNTANINDAKVKIETTADTDNVTAGSTLHVEVTAEDVYLIEPSMTPPSDRLAVAGHFEFFIDSMSATSVMVTAEESVDVLIPPTTPAGGHKLLCRVDKHDGTPTAATSEIAFTVKAVVSGN